MSDMTDEHEHNFIEEQEPSGRLILLPCLECGLTAYEALASLKNNSLKIGELYEKHPTATDEGFILKRNETQHYFYVKGEGKYIQYDGWGKSVSGEQEEV